MEARRRNEKNRAAVIKANLLLPAAFLVLTLVCAGAAAQTGYPAKPVRFIVPSAAGGGTDIIARALAQKLTESFGAQFVVDNRPGAGQMIAIEMVATSSVAGHPILIAASNPELNPIMYQNLTYAP